MMSKIKIMPEQLANQIAAGEVVERPASVVKELIENSLDAGATIIRVKVKQAGMEEIVVTDNGQGMSSADARIAFERHATSKLYHSEDLFRIHTLGFRGEALPSIASVSQLTLQTAEKNEPGILLKLEGGEIIEESSAPAREGTTITVKQLFYNTPARLKYIKTLSTELGHITDLLNRYALARPDVSFHLDSDDSQLLKTVGNGDLRQALAAVYGVSHAKKMVPIDGENINYAVKGYISLPELTRATNRYMTFIINGRVIRNYALTRSVIAGYRTKLMVGRYPIGVVQIEMDPQLLDVNVHPTKHEVRISDEKELGGLITEAVEEALDETVRIPSGFTQTESSHQSFQSVKADQLSLGAFQSTKPVHQHSKIDISSEATELDKDRAQAWLISEEMAEPAESTSANTVGTGHQNDNYLAMAEKELTKPTDGTKNEREFPYLEYIGQLHGTYLLAQNERGLYLIDQHAAQERIKYEEYRESILSEGTSLQTLLTPISFDLSAIEFKKISRHLDQLGALGVHLEHLGQQTVILREHPSWMPVGEVEAIVRDMFDFILDDRSLDLKLFREATAIMMSCKRSIKANHYLTKNEAEQLIQDLSQSENPYNCPHGRPVLIHLSLRDLEKMFKRIQDPH